MAELGRGGKRIAVMCPGFAADCLATIEEIGLRGHEQFHEAGGQDYLAIPCVHLHPAWLAALPPDVIAIDATKDRQKFLVLVPERTGAGSIPIVRNWQPGT